MTQTFTENRPLQRLPAMLAEEPALRAVIARAPAVAVPDAARPLFVSALAASTTRRPLVVAVPTGAEAERLARDLAQFVDTGSSSFGDVELFPAWETLPFERVSPSLETMGRRLRVMWRVGTGGGHPPPGVGAPARARAPPPRAPPPGAPAGGRPPRGPPHPPPPPAPPPPP